MHLFIPLLTVLFIALKLTLIIDWPWIWVLSPLWIGFLITALVLVVIVLFTTRLSVRVTKLKPIQN